MFLPLTALIAACQPTEVVSEPILLPADPAAEGAPVGVRTAEINGITFDIWYPTTDAVSGGPERLDLADYVPLEFLDRVGGTIDIPTLATRAHRDAPVRLLDEALPLVLFSHGFGGFRQQSVDLTSHLASRGYVVAAPDHVGRDLASIVPCLLIPAAGTCNLSFSNHDVGDLTSVLDWFATGPEGFADLVDVDTVGVFGHSAGGAATVAFTNAEPRVDAALPMAGADAFDRDLPTAVLGGSCDGVIPETDLKSAGSTAREGYYSVVDAGHMAFSDLCTIDLGALGEQLGQREDASGTFIDSMMSLAIDGCPGYTPPVLDGCGGTYPPLEDTAPILRNLVTVFFDQHLLGRGDGLAGETFEGVERR